MCDRHHACTKRPPRCPHEGDNAVSAANGDVHDDPSVIKVGHAGVRLEVVTHAGRRQVGNRRLHRRRALQHAVGRAGEGVVGECENEPALRDPLKPLVMSGRTFCRATARPAPAETATIPRRCALLSVSNMPCT